jgi:hypothetical protein
LQIQAEKVVFQSVAGSLGDELNRTQLKAIKAKRLFHLFGACIRRLRLRKKDHAGGVLGIRWLAFASDYYIQDSNGSHNTLLGVLGGIIVDTISKYRQSKPATLTV